MKNVRLMDLASRGFHEDIEGTKDRRRIRHVQSMHSKYFDGGGEEGGRGFWPYVKKEESPSEIESSFIWKVESFRSWEPT